MCIIYKILMQYLMKFVGMLFLLSLKKKDFYRELDGFTLVFVYEIFPL